MLPIIRFLFYKTLYLYIYMHLLNMQSRQHKKLRYLYISIYQLYYLYTSSINPHKQTFPYIGKYFNKNIIFFF